METKLLQELSEAHLTRIILVCHEGLHFVQQLRRLLSGVGHQGLDVRVELAGVCAIQDREKAVDGSDLQHQQYQYQHPHQLKNR